MGPTPILRTSGQAEKDLREAWVRVASGICEPSLLKQFGARPHTEWTGRQKRFAGELVNAVAVALREAADGKLKAQG